jgi:hypothetical protein
LAEAALKGETKYPHINRKYVSEEHETELKVDCETKFTSGIQGKMYYMLQWMQNINFLAGNQWISYDSAKRMFEIDPNLGEEERVTMNKVLPAYRLAVGSIIRDRSKPKVLQLNNDEQSIDSSKVNTKLLDHIRRTNDGLYTIKETVEWAAICGKGIVKKWWDPEQKKIVDEVIQPFEWITPSNVRKMDKMPWGCHARYETTEWVYEMYGIDVSDDKDAKDKGANKVNTSGSSDYGQYGSFLSVVKHVMEDGYFTGSGATMNNNNILVKEFWFRPNKRYPKGLLVIFLNDILIYADKNPISGDDEEFYWPINEFDFFDMPFRYWPMSLIEPVIGMQSYYNKFMSYGLDAYKTNGFGAWWAQAGAVAEGEVITDGKTVNEFSGNQAPQFKNTSAFDPKLFEIISQMGNGIQEIIGIHQFSKGTMPGVHAAAALAIINEQDQISKMPIAVNLEKFLRTDGLKNLYLVRKYWPKKMTIRIMGEENRWEVVDFEKEKHLTGEEEIEIESKQELAQDKMTRFDQVFKLMTTPRIDTPKEPILDVNAGLRILDLEHEMNTVSLRELNWNMAKDENQRMAKGEKVQAFQYEDHKLHLEALMQFMLRIEFKELKEEIKQIFMEHYQQHLAMLNTSQQSLGAQATQGDPQQGQQPMGGMMPGQMQQMPMQPMMQPHPMMGQPPMQGPPNVIPMQPTQNPQINTGIASGLQGGMHNALNHAAGRPGG